MARITSRSICPRAGALAAIAFIVLAVGSANAGNTVVFPAHKWPTLTGQGAYTVPTWSGDGAKIVALGDSTRFIRPNGNTWMRCGNIWHMADPSTEQGWQASWSWPGGKTTYLRIASEQERFGSVSRKQGMMMATRNWIPPSSADSAKMVNDVTSRTLVPQTHSVQHGFRGNGSWGGLGIFDHVQVNRYLPQQTVVNGIVLMDQTDPYGPDPGTLPTGAGATEYGKVRGIVDPALPSHRVVYDHSRWQLGVDVQQIIHGYGINNNIDSDYLLYEFWLSNTGAVSRRPKSAVAGHLLPLQDYWFSFNWHVRPADPDMVLGNSNDDVVEFFEPWPTYTNSSGVGHQAVMFYDGDKTGKGDWGGPNYNFSPSYRMGYDLWAKQYTGVGWVFVESAPGTGEDDPSQPQGTNYTQERDFNLSWTPFGNDMTKQYRTIFCSGQRIKADLGTDDVPRRRPNGAYDGSDPNLIFPPATKPESSVGLTDPTPYIGNHWSSFPYNSQLHLVMAVAAGGVNDERARELGKIQSRRRDSGSSTWQLPAEITEIKTGRDSVKKVMDRAFWNIHGYDPNGSRWQAKPAAYNQAFNVPDPPAPPPCAWMSSSEGMNAIEWLPISDAEKNDHDSGVQDFLEYRVYRAVGLPDSEYTMVYHGPATRFEDTAVSKDFVYYYYVVSADDGSQNFSNPGVKLESGKFWLWNGWYDQGVRPSTRRAKTVADLSNIRVVPNPYNVRLNFPQGSMASEIVWKGLPNKCTVRIYTAAGDFVKEIIHETAESGSEPWDMRTDNNQYIATGVYIYTVESRDPSISGSHVGKFIVVR